MFPVTDHVVKTARHTSFYLACGAADAPLIVFVHGWPELSISWRHQLPCFAALGFRAIAPDMRGYGRSTVHTRHLTEIIIRTGHWMAQENPVAVNQALAGWISRKMPSVWRP